jgi:asparagine synthase (glutamine-hydrolysing)
VEVLKSHAARCDSEDALSQVQYADFKTYLPGDILTKVDRASMANSLEVRVPLLDHTLVEWAARLPSHLKLHGREGKYIFKSALEPHVHKEILYRQKQGFAVPLAEWFRGPLRQSLRESLGGPVPMKRDCSTWRQSRCSSISIAASETTARCCGRYR